MLLIIIIFLILFAGGGWFIGPGTLRNGSSLISILLLIFVIYLLFNLVH